jgi:hypothetical protein
MLEQLIIKCDCKVDDCNLYLIITPIGSISITEGQNFLAGIHLSSNDIDKLISKLTEIKNIYKENEEWISNLLLGIDKNWMKFLEDK